jgi:hypothetical protein
MASFFVLNRVCCVYFSSSFNLFSWRISRQHPLGFEQNLLWRIPHLKHLVHTELLSESTSELQLVIHYIRYRYTLKGPG